MAQEAERGLGAKALAQARRLILPACIFVVLLILWEIWVVEGLEVVDKIRAVPTRPYGGHRNVPVEPVVIEEVVPIESQPGSGNDTNHPEAR